MSKTLNYSWHVSMLLSALFMLGVTVHAAAETWDEAVEESEDDDSSSVDFSGGFDRQRHSNDRIEPAPKKAKSVSFPGYGPYTKDFKSLCEAMERDGRSAALSEVLLARLRKDPECPGCYPFFRTLMVQCKQKKGPVSKKNVGTPKPPLQREPNMSVHMVAEDMALRLAEDEKRGAATALVIQQFKKLLAAEPTLTPGARDYFDMLLAALEEPFLREESEGASAKSNSESGTADPEVSIDDIFEGDV